MRVDRRFFGVLAAALLPLAGCAAARPLPSDPAKTLALAGPAFGRREMRPTRCVSGGHFSYLGAEAVDESAGLIVRLVVDPLTGSAVRVFDHQDSDRRSVVFRRADCRRFDVDLEPTGSWVNGVDMMSLAVALDCRTADGDAVVGAYTATECQ